MAEALIQACESGDSSHVQKCISKGVDVNSLINGETPLHTASSKGFLKIVTILINAGADINKTDNFGLTPLHQAIMSNYVDIVKHLVTSGANVSLLTDKKQNILHLASRFSSSEILNYLLQETDVDLAQKDQTDRTPLHYATKRGNKDIIISLLKKKGLSCLQVKDSSGYYPFQYLSFSAPEPQPKKKNRDIEQLLEDLKALWTGGENTDIHIRFDDGNNIRAHKAILWARCPALRKSIKSNDDEITISGVEKQTMHVVLEYLYTGRVEDLDETSHSSLKNPHLCFKVLKAAHELQLSLLEEQCERHLIRTLDVHSITDIILGSEELSHPWPLLKNRCGDYLIRNFGLLAERDDVFSKISKDFVVDAIQNIKILPRETAKKAKTRKSSSSSKTGEAVSQPEHFKSEESDSSLPSSAVASLRDGPGSEIPAAGKVAVKCKTMIKSLSNDKNAWPFLEPVDPISLNIPDYFDVIKHPMDLGTIKKRLDTGYYSTIAELNFDVHLTFNNALTYNIPGSDICLMAEHLLESWSKKYTSLLKQIEEQPENWKVEAIRSKTKKTDSDKKKNIQPMTYEEKKKLGEQINQLDSEQLQRVVEIISKTFGPSENEQDLEVDMNDLGDETLRELEAYVQSCIRHEENQKESHETDSKKLKKKRSSTAHDSDATDDDPRERKEKHKQKKHKAN